MNTQKEARRDAREFARAAMFYGEGAGTRRKLIGATVQSKSDRSPEYSRAFHQELERQDIGEHAKKARREREIKDKSHSVNKNVRGIATGNYASVNTSVIVVLAAVAVAHKTGLDKVLIEKTKKLYWNVKIRVQSKKTKQAVQDLLDGVRHIH